MPYDKSLEQQIYEWYHAPLADQKRLLDTILYPFTSEMDYYSESSSSTLSRTVISEDAVKQLMEACIRVAQEE